MAMGRERNKAKSQGGLTLTCDGHWKAHKFQDDDGQTQTSISWARRPPSPLPLSPPPTSPRPLRDADGGWRCRGLCALLCSSACLRLTPFPHEQLSSLLYSSKPFAGLLSSLSPPFEFHSKDRHILLQINQSVLLLPPRVALTPNKLPKHHTLWQTLLPHTCYESRKQYPPFEHYRLYAPGSCLGKRVGVR